MPVVAGGGRIDSQVYFDLLLSGAIMSELQDQIRFLELSLLQVVTSHARLRVEVEQVRKLRGRLIPRRASRRRRSRYH